MTDQTASSFFIKTPVIVAGIAFTIWSAVLGIAAVKNFNASSYLETWSNLQAHTPDYQITDTDYQSTLNDSLDALKLAPYNNDYRLTAATVMMWKFQHDTGLTPAERTVLKAGILDHYRHALKQQPFSPYYYTNYAITKAQLGDFDADFMAALQEAHRLGPYEVYVLHSIINLGLYSWPKLDHASQQLTALAIDKTLSWDINSIDSQKERALTLSTVGLYRRQAEVCPLLKVRIEQVQRMCATTTPGSAKAHK